MATWKEREGKVERREEGKREGEKERERRSHAASFIVGQAVWQLRGGANLAAAR